MSVYCFIYFLPVITRQKCRRTIYFACCQSRLYVFTLNISLHIAGFFALPISVSLDRCVNFKAHTWFYIAQFYILLQFLKVNFCGKNYYLMTASEYFLHFFLMHLVRIAGGVKPFVLTEREKHCHQKCDVENFLEASIWETACH